MSIAHIEPIPTPERYDHAYATAEVRLQELGGIENFIRNRMLETEFDEDLQLNNMMLAQHAFRLMSANSEFPSDQELLHTSHAYIHGFITTALALDEVYSNVHTEVDRLQAVESWFDGVLRGIDANDENWYETVQKKTIGMSAYGLQRLGGEALDQLSEWSRRLYESDTMQSRLFQLAGGVAVTSSYIHQRRLNDTIVELMARNLDTELQQDLGESHG